MQKHNKTSLFIIIFNHFNLHHIHVVHLIISLIHIVNYSRNNAPEWDSDKVSNTFVFESI